MIHIMTIHPEVASAAAPSTAPVALQLDTRGPYDLAQVAMMGFGHRHELSFDGVMRLAFCLDGDYERQVGVEVRQHDERLALVVRTPREAAPLDPDELITVKAQVARVVSVDHDGCAFAQMCQADPVLSRLHAGAAGFRPALFYSPYEAAVWSIISARRARPQGIGLRQRLATEFGATFELAGVNTSAVPTPTQLLALDTVPGLPTDRVPRLHAVAEAAQRGELTAARLAAMDPDAARAELQRLPGIGPFYSSLIVVRACGLADVLSTEETHSRDAVEQLYHSTTRCLHRTTPNWRRVGVPSAPGSRCWLAWSFRASTPPSAEPGQCQDLRSTKRRVGSASDR